METNIVTQDVYLPISEKTRYYVRDRQEVPTFHTYVEKHTGMVVLTKDELIKIIGEAFNKGQDYANDHNPLSEFSKFNAPSAAHFIASIFKSTGLKT